MIELYTDANPNGLKVSVGLEEMASSTTFTASSSAATR
jgi:hypothetical protein